MEVTITTSHACKPTAHRAGCKDLARVRRRHDFAGEYTASFDTIADVALDYWQDIILGDHGLTGEAAYDLALEYTGEGALDVAPCVKLPLRPTPAPAPDGMPKQGTPLEQAVRLLRNDELAQRIGNLVAKPQTGTRAERNAWLEEAARRLRWQDAYNGSGRSDI